MKTKDKPGLVPGDGRVIVAFDPEVRVFPCEVEAWYTEHKRPVVPAGYFQGTPEAEGPPLRHFHGKSR